MIRAQCPLCRRQVKAFWHGPRLIYEFHPQTPGQRIADDPSLRCEGSGWLVEDDEVCT